jgi:hypothetical protein
MRSTTLPFLLTASAALLLIAETPTWSQAAPSNQQAVTAPAPRPATPPLRFDPVQPIAPPEHPLSEAGSAGVTKFSFIAYGDTRSGANGDGVVVHPIHTAVVDGMLAAIKSRERGDYPIRFVLQTGDAVLRGATGRQWNVSYTPIIERLTRGADTPYFLTVGNHDVSATAPPGDATRQLGLHNTLTAISRLIPSEGSPRRLSGYATYAFGYGNTFVVALDTTIAADPLQLAWVTDQLERLDRARFTHVMAFVHYPPFSSGPHGYATLEPQTLTIRSMYMPLFRKHHVRMILAGHEHLYDHWVERYADGGKDYRIDAIVTGGGGAPIYTYRGEPDLAEYLAAGASQNVRVDHLARPSATIPGNPNHFVIIQVDGERLSIEVVAAGDQPFAPFNGRSRISLDEATW